MSIEKQDNERIELYNRFKQSLGKKSADDLYFDADDLIVIFDQAVDFNDQYVQIEAVMRGYRYFPDNSELASRRGLLYYSMNLDNGVNDIVAIHGDNSPLWKLIKLRGSESEWDSESNNKALQIFDEILNTPGKFDDETIIQLVDTASETENYEWLKNNEARLREKTEYLPSLLYELSAVAEENNELKHGISLLEELTALEPFNLDFWISLAQAQLRNKDYEGALSSSDYALAIASDDSVVINTKACALGNLGHYQEVVDLVLPFLDNENNDESKDWSLPDEHLVENYLRALMALGSEKRMELLISLMGYAAIFPENRAIIGIALDSDYPAIEVLLESHFEACSEEYRNDWFDWGRRLMLFGCSNEASLVLDVLFKKGLIKNNTQIGLFVSALYTSKNYERCIEVYEHIIHHAHSLLTPDVAVAGLLSYARIKTKAQCKKAFTTFQKNLPMSNSDVWHIGSELETVGFSTFLGMYQALLNRSGALDADSIDIFKLPASYTDDKLDFPVE